MEPRKPKIVFVLSQYSVGGAETQLAALIERRPAYARGVELHAVSFLPTQSIEIEKRYEAEGVIHHLVDRGKMRFPVFMARLMRTLRRIRPDIVHTLLDSSTGAWGRLAARLVGVKTIVHSDLALMVEGTRAHLLLRPYLDLVTTRFFPNAESIADRLVATGVPRHKIQVIPNGVDLDRFRVTSQAAAREAGDLPNDAVIAGFLGRFAHEKRLDVLLDAVMAMPEPTRPDLLLIAGDGPTMEQIRRTVDETPWLSEHARLLGIIHDAPGFLASIDYLVLTSDTEGLPNVLLEAMAMARPVVATRVSDIPLRLGDAGFLAKAGDVGSVASAMQSMQALTKEARAALGAHARARIETHHAMEVVADLFWKAHMDLMPAVVGPVEP